MATLLERNKIVINYGNVCVLNQSSEHKRTHTNNRPANLNQPLLQYTQRHVRQDTDTHIP